MSRVSYVMMNPGGEVEMTRAVREAIATLAAQVAERPGIDPRDILELTFVGNPIMHHLLLGIDPTELGGAPFALATNEAITLWASELDQLGVHRQRAGLRAALHRRPRRRGYRGRVALRDAASGRRGHADRRRRHQRRDRARQPPPPARGLLADRPGVRGRADLLRPARSAGCDRARPDRPRDARAALQGDRLRPLVGRAGLCRGDPAQRRHRHLRLGHHRGAGRDVPRRHPQAATARSTVPRPRCSPRIQPDGRTFSYLLRAGEPELRIHQNDVRAIQLAKAALYAGARLLMDHLGVERVDRITLAGAFGSHIDTTYAMVLGPDPGLRPRQGLGRRQRRRHRRPDRAAESHRAQRDRAAGQADREDRDRARAALPGALRRRHGDPAQDRALPEPRRGRRAARAGAGRAPSLPAMAGGAAGAAVEAGGLCFCSGFPGNPFRSARISGKLAPQPRARAREAMAAKSRRHRTGAR